MSASGGAALPLSVIIPTLDEEARLARTLTALLPPAAPRFEVIVSDGGSADATLAEAGQFASVRAIRAPRGRAAQMNAGAAAARGATLLFLHADTILDAAAIERLIDILPRNPALVGGAFRFRLDSRRRRYRLIEWGVRQRTRLFKLPYGDQGLFVRRAVFRRLGGFRPYAVGEDLDFARRLRREGPLLLLDEAVVTSARRWEEHGFLRTTLRNWIILGRSACGRLPLAPESAAAPPDRDARARRGKPGARREKERAPAR